jgi:antirestriction protein ArdC
VAEEIIAELCSAFTCARLEITNGPRPNHVHYLQNWLGGPGKDPQAIFSAASSAQKAADRLFGLQPARPATCVEPITTATLST